MKKAFREDPGLKHVIRHEFLLMVDEFVKLYQHEYGEHDINVPIETLFPNHPLLPRYIVLKNKLFHS